MLWSLRPTLVMCVRNSNFGLLVSSSKQWRDVVSAFRWRCLPAAALGQEVLLEHCVWKKEHGNRYRLLTHLALVPGQKAKFPGVALQDLALL